MTLEELKKYHKIMSEDIKNSPYLYTLVIGLLGGYVYVCGHVFLSGYLLGEDYYFKDILFDPLPLPHGHVIAIGIALNLFIIILVFLALVFLLSFEARKKFTGFLVLLFTLSIGFLTTNVFNSRLSLDDIEYSGLILVLYVLFVIFVIYLMKYLRYLLIILALLMYWSLISILLNIFLDDFQIEEKLAIGSMAIKIFILVLVFCCFHFAISRKEDTTSKLIKELSWIIFPVISMVTLIVVDHFKFMDINIAVTVIIASLVISIITASISKNSYKNYRFLERGLELKHIWSIYKKASIIMKVSLTLLISLAIIPQLVASSGTLLNENVPLEKNQFICSNNEFISGRYIGEKSGLYYYVSENGLVKTKNLDCVSSSPDKELLLKGQ